MFDSFYVNSFFQFMKRLIYSDNYLEFLLNFYFTLVKSCKISTSNGEQIY